MNSKNNKDNKEDHSKKCAIPEADVDELIPRLYLGNYKSSYDEPFLRKHNIKYIFRVMPEFDNNKVYNGINYIHIPIKDNEMCLKNLDKLYDYTSDTIAKILLNQYNVGILVHCKRGHHRSAALIAAFFIKYLKINYNTAAKYISRPRPCALRRESCMVVALREYEKNVINRNVTETIMSCCNFSENNRANFSENNRANFSENNRANLNNSPHIHRVDLKFI
jgi:protein tyrosine/serine phosphatase